MQLHRHHVRRGRRHGDQEARPSAAGAYNPPNSGASKMGDAGATDGELPATGIAAAISRLPGRHEVELASVGAPHRPLTAAGRDRDSAAHFREAAQVDLGAAGFVRRVGERTARRATGSSRFRSAGVCSSRCGDRAAVGRHREEVPTGVARESSEQDGSRVGREPGRRTAWSGDFVMRCSAAVPRVRPDDDVRRRVGGDAVRQRRIRRRSTPAHRSNIRRHADRRARLDDRSSTPTTRPCASRRSTAAGGRRARATSAGTPPADAATLRQAVRRRDRSTSAIPAPDAAAADRPAPCARSRTPPAPGGL